jgi:hypothetical protein
LAHHRGGGGDKRQTADGRAAELRRLRAWLTTHDARHVAFEVAMLATARKLAELYDRAMKRGLD